MNKVRKYILVAALVCGFLTVAVEESLAGITIDCQVSANTCAVIHTDNNTFILGGSFISISIH